MIKLINLNKTYQGRGLLPCHALKNINLQLPDTGFVMILGPSGCGKTTLLNILGGLDYQDSGEMIVDGRNTSNFKESDWNSYRNQEVGFVLQNYYLLPNLSIKDNVGLTLELSNQTQALEYRVDESLKTVGLYKKRKQKPSTLSGGQKQRVAIARALISNPTMILADEPTGALDSNSAEQILDLMKSLSKEHLILMVTHNREFAEKYGDRIIELKDGEVVNDTNPMDTEIVTNNERLLKVKVPLKITTGWSIRNIGSRLARTISTIVASSIGLTAIGLVLCLTTNCQGFMIEYENAALSTQPLYLISQYQRESNVEQGENYRSYEEYPSIEAAYVDRGYSNDYVYTYRYEHTSYFPQEVIDYVEEIDSGLCNVVDSNSFTNFKVLLKTPTQYSQVQNYLTKMVSNDSFMESQYDCLRGRIPQEKDEIAIVLDTYNRISVSFFNALGVPLVDEDGNNIDEIPFDYIEQLELRYVDINDWYEYDSTNNIYKGPNDWASLYDEGMSLKVSGILRQKRSALSPIYGYNSPNRIHYAQNFILSSPKLTEYALEQAQNSQIIKDQIQYGLTRNVLTGEPFVDTGGNTVYTAQYHYENQLYNLGAREVIESFYFFPSSIEARQKIIDYLNAFPAESIETGFSIYDPMEVFSTLYGGLLGVIRAALYVLSGLMILVSAILNVVLVYISVLERRNEIGLLRTLGARRIDVAVMVETESVFTGLLSGFIGVLISYILSKPVGALLASILDNYVSTYGGVDMSGVYLGTYVPWAIPLIIGLALILNLVAALIPAYIASRQKPIDCLIAS